MNAKVARLLVIADQRLLNGRTFRFTAQNPVYGTHQIGRFTYGTPTIIGRQARLTIGAFCSIAQEVTIFLGDAHRVDWITTYPFSVMLKDAPSIEGHPSAKGDVVIGNDVWIARGATILSGVTIGQGSVIAANSVVTKSVGNYEMVAGNPARKVRDRFPLDIVEALMEIAWWNWDEAKIRANLHLLLQPDPRLFINVHRSRDRHVEH